MLLPVRVGLTEDEQTVVHQAVGLVLDESPEDATAAAMTDYSVRLAAAIALRTALEEGSLPAGTDLGPLCELVWRVRTA